ncbi:DUF3299 domain-containing protein [Pseudophaeobacter flagellatus]|uniref:DUF3299 domain-containing protein n=1 Tax=Pseudophaeobacter flagellatus TaxID=2899119 RepID=UPI001E5C3B3D|nr:DUF3299 domain-containing protein [Pseudophaeobacter flagellatus]MCD9149269.1 DUF3299 domain-containing protein [Pseudophaeobacter flagellatus]
MHPLKMCLSTVLFVALLTGFGIAQAQERQIVWRELAPEAEPYENPFEKLSTQQISDLRMVLLNEMTAEDLSSTDAVNQAKSRLEADGLDIDYLRRQREIVIEKRTAAATGTNPTLVNTSVKIAGYMLPLRVDDRKVTEFLLVPTVGACIHTPPPPANQMVHVRYPEGFEAKGLYTAVWVSGRLRANQATHTVSYIDGSTAVDVAYKLEASSIEKY